MGWRWRGVGCMGSRGFFEREGEGRREKGCMRIVCMFVS